MSNLEIENLARPMQVDRSEMSGIRISPEAQNRYEQKVTEEMSLNGMPSPEAHGLSPGSGNTFSDVLRKSVENVNQFQVEADQAVKEMVAGRNKNIHETMLAVERADVSLKLMMQVRNKIIDAYKEIMRMQI